MESRIEYILTAGASFGVAITATGNCTQDAASAADDLAEWVPLVESVNMLVRRVEHKTIRWSITSRSTSRSTSMGMWRPPKLYAGRGNESLNLSTKKYF